MIKVWLIWVQGDNTTWLESAWAQSDGEYEAEINRITAMCAKNGYTMRVQAVNIPGVHELFDIPTVTAEPA